MGQIKNLDIFAPEVLENFGIGAMHNILSYDDVNKLLTNVYSQGFYDADKPYLKEEGGDNDIFTQKHADIVCKALDDNKIKGIGIQTLKKLKDLVNSLVVV